MDTQSDSGRGASHPRVTPKARLPEGNRAFGGAVAAQSR